MATVGVKGLTVAGWVVLVEHESVQWRHCCRTSFARRAVINVRWIRQVAETMFNPFGEDDDDYEMNMFIDQYMKVR